MKTSSAERDPAGELLKKMDANKPFGLNGVHPQALRVLANVTGGHSWSCLKIFERP